MRGSEDSQFIKQLRNELDHSLQNMLGDSKHSLYYRLYDEMADAVGDSDVGADPKYQELIFLPQYYYLPPLERSLMDLPQFVLEFDTVIPSNVGLFVLKTEGLVCKDPFYGLVSEIINFKVVSLIPEP